MQPSQTQDSDRALAYFLIQKGILSPDKSVYYLEVALQKKIPLAQLLLQQKLLTPQQERLMHQWLQRGQSLALPAIQGEIPGYKIVEKIGSGGMGSVFKAKHLRMGRDVAIKVLSKKHAEDKMYISRFLREAKSLAKLNHPNIVRAYDCNRVGETYYLVMEFVEGISAYDRLAERLFSEQEIIQLGMQLASAMAHYNQANMVHRDIKPDNILITKDGSAKLCDLGLAKSDKDTKITAQGTTLGTPQYISPEQAQGKSLDIRADIYSLGATFFHMVVGEEPYVGNNIVLVMQKHLYDPVQSARERGAQISEALDAILMKMMAKNPEDRYQTPEELYQDFHDLSQGRPPSSLNSSPKKKKLSKQKRPISRLSREKKGTKPLRPKDRKISSPKEEEDPATYSVKKTLAWYKAAFFVLLSVILILLFILLQN
ncbi:MAG: serine/threonine protein kinase [Planctomycetota bacterium]|nr:MAG: serine/threonine protein kinase [Planctomycetota bacterium]